MELGKGQKRFIKAKTVGFQVLKGEVRTGKTTIAVNKVVLIENKYCMYDEDKILYITSDYRKCEEINKLYNSTKEEKKYEVMTLFSSDRARVKVFTRSEIIEIYAKSYIKEKKNES